MLESPSLSTIQGEASLQAIPDKPLKWQTPRASLQPFPLNLPLIYNLSLFFNLKTPFSFWLHSGHLQHWLHCPGWLSLADLSSKSYESSSHIPFAGSRKKGLLFCQIHLIFKKKKKKKERTKRKKEQKTKQNLKTYLQLLPKESGQVHGKKWDNKGGGT